MVENNERKNELANCESMVFWHQDVLRGKLIHSTTSCNGVFGENNWWSACSRMRSAGCHVGLEVLHGIHPAHRHLSSDSMTSMSVFKIFMSVVKAPLPTKKLRFTSHPPPNPDKVSGRCSHRPTAGRATPACSAECRDFRSFRSFTERRTWKSWS